MNEQTDSVDGVGVSMEKLKRLRKTYDKKCWCHKKTFRQFKKRNNLLNGFILLIMAVAMIVGSAGENNYMMIALTALGTLVKGWSDFKKFPNKVEMSKFAYTTYAKCLTEIDSYINGVELEDLQSFLTKMQAVEDTVIDLAPPFSQKCEEDYEKQMWKPTIDRSGSIDISVCTAV